MMKKRLLLCFFSIWMIQTGFSQNSISPVSVEKSTVQESHWTEIFKPIPATEITDNVFKAFGTDWACITAMKDSMPNSMTASFGGWGILFGKPVVWCFLRANRYTLELIRESKMFTVSYFDTQYKDQLLLFGSKSGRNSNKMKETRLTFINTPDGNVSYQEARLILECKLINITTVHPEDFYTEEGKQFVLNGYRDVQDYHKFVFGEITHVWIRK